MRRREGSSPSSLLRMPMLARAELIERGDASSLRSSARRAGMSKGDFPTG